MIAAVQLELESWACVRYRCAPAARAAAGDQGARIDGFVLPKEVNVYECESETQRTATAHVADKSSHECGRGQY